MDINLDAFHFLRPLFLWLIPVAVVLVLVWHWLSDPRRRWQGIISAHLLSHLLVDHRRAWRWRPVHATSLALILIALAAAGPTWETELPPFTEDKAPLVIALDMSHSMDAVDIPPTRLERAKQKIRELMKLRPGSRTGLIVYSGTAHLVLPPTDDPDFMSGFLDALDTSLMPKPGKNAVGALQIADKLLSKETAAGTILFFTDGFETTQISEFKAHQQASATQILLLAVGTEHGGPLRSSNGRVVIDSSGRPELGKFDQAALKQLASSADIPLASVTLGDDDVKWVQRRALSHMQAAQEKNAQVRWKEAGYYLTIPIVLLAAFWFRRGWVIRWMPALLVATLFIATPRPVYAASFHVIDAFMTPDQQGRWQFEHGHFSEAAARFNDPMWKGRAFYRAGDYAAALTAFASLQSPDAYFMMGNCYARLNDYPNAVVAYDHALKGRTRFPQAAANRALVAALIPKVSPKKDEQQEQATNLKPDDIKFDNKGDKGKLVKMDTARLKALNAELWMRNLQTTPAYFLRQKFLIEAQNPQPAAPAPKATP